ncbi:MAG: amidohydrolase family protein [Candidatus Latescibacterota bacterium]
MVIVDAHMHLWDHIDGFLGAPVRSIGNGQVTLGSQKMMGMPPYLLDGRCTWEIALSVMDAAGVYAAVVTQEYLDGNQNAYLAEAEKKNPERLFVHGLLDFFHPERLSEEFEEVMREYEFKGIKVPAMNLPKAGPRIFLNDPKCMTVFEKMEKRGMVLSIDLHPSDCQVEEMREVARSFPRLTVTLGHFAMANREGWLKQMSLAKEPNVYVESGGITWLYRLDGPPFPGAQEAFRIAAEHVGADKLMWGSDHPRTMVDFTYEQALDFLLDGCPFFSDTQKKAILGETALRIYGIKKPLQEPSRMKKITED